MDLSKTVAVLSSVAVGLAVVLLPITSAGSTITAERSRVGRLYDGRVEVADTRHRSYLELPTGRLSIGMDVLPAIRVDDPDASYKKISILAPRSGGFVRVAWTLDRRRDEVRDGEFGYERGPYDFDSLMLVAGGSRWLLSAGDGDLSGSAIWAVPGDTTDARVEVTYDGVVQRLDPRTGKRDVGRAAALYGGSTEKGTCATPTIKPPFSAARKAADAEASFTCKYQVRRLGYIGGVGWAPAGKAWFVVDTLLEPADDLPLVRDGKQVEYSIVDRGYVTSRLQGREGKPARGAYDGSNYGHALYWLVPLDATPPTSLVFEQSLLTVPSSRRYDRDADERQLDLSWTVPLR